MSVSSWGCGAGAAWAGPDPALAGIGALGVGWTATLGVPREGKGGMEGDGIGSRPIGDPNGDAREPGAGGPRGAARAVRGGVKQVVLRWAAELPPGAW